jgi:hypothetical protein
MNMYFVDFFSIHDWLSFVTNVVYNLSNTTKGNIVTNVALIFFSEFVQKALLKYILLYIVKGYHLLI